MNLRVNANAIVTNSEGKFLLIKLKRGPFAGGLCIPGGGIYPGELSHDAARREVFEETGIFVESDFKPFGFCELRSDKVKQHKIVMLLHAEAEGSPKNTEEGEAEWYSYEEAEPNLILFAKEAIIIWKNNEAHFRLVDEDVDIRDYSQQTSQQEK